MKLLALTAALALGSPALLAAPADALLTRKIHTEGSSAGVGATDSIQRVWIGKDRLRVETEERISIVRLDQKKLHLLDPKARTAATVELPIELQKYVPEEMAGLLTQMRGASTVVATVTATQETKKIGAWNAQKFTLEVRAGELPVESVVLWTTRDLPIDARAYLDMTRLLTALRPGTEAVVEEMKKLEGVPVLTERTRTLGASPIHIREELVSVETQDAPEGTWDVPADYASRPFDPLAEAKTRRGPVPGK